MYVLLVYINSVSVCMCVCVFQVAELEAQLGHPAAGQTGREELSQSVEELKALLSAKDQASRCCWKLLPLLRGSSAREPQS